ncbi:cytoplasmic protein [Neobacillus notoginsengisoli]|uniref:Cytoplasmic protein n=1 Tax=Neobacillus notoginsengisoli TaxID=1578198 RepID=A0A417Z0C6_9BACI|nr:cytoplasmic protein [Neobacillus notoginsengisoli]RHW43610.1 cytoplasmic protein [Neobacillus notoginsengisoli]
MEKQFKKAHRFCRHNRKDLENDTICGCFYCLKIFNPNEIDEWWDDDDTAVCPYCGIDSVIGESSGFSITELFLKEMNKEWF